jgi:hypothetical protein
MVAGVFIFLMSIDIIHVPEENFSAPRWLVAVVGLVFTLAGMMVIVQGLSSRYGDFLPKYVYNGLLLVFMVLFALPVHWVAFGSGERQFSSSVGMSNLSVTQSSTGEIEGRLVFGIGAIIMDFIIIYIVYKIIKGHDLSKR